MSIDLLIAEVNEADVPVARVLPRRAPTLVEYLLGAVEDLQHRTADNWDAGSDSETMMAIGGVQALLGVLEWLTEHDED